MSHCGDAHQWMSGALDRRLAPEEARALEAHLRVCLQCRDTWVALQEVDRLLSARPAVPVPAGLAERTLARLEARWETAARPHRSDAFWLAAGVALVALSLLVWWAALLGVPALLSLTSPAVWSGLRLFWEALTTAVRSLMHLLDSLLPFCRSMALASGVLILALSLAVAGGGLRRARLRV